MTASRQELELAALSSAFSTHLSSTGWGTIPFNDGFEVDEQLRPPLIAIQFLPSGPEPFQMGDTVEKYYRRVMQLDVYMTTKARVSALNDELMDYIDLMAVSIADPMVGNTVVGSITCQNTDSIYSEIAPPNLENPKVRRWRGIVRATLDMHYPTG